MAAGSGSEVYCDLLLGQGLPSIGIGDRFKADLGVFRKTVSQKRELFGFVRQVYFCLFETFTNIFTL